MRMCMQATLALVACMETAEAKARFKLKSGHSRLPREWYKYNAGITTSSRKYRTQRPHALCYGFVEGTGVALQAPQSPTGHSIKRGGTGLCCSCVMRFILVILVMGFDTAHAMLPLRD